MIEYVIRCDGCGAVIATSRTSARHARAEAALERRAACSRKGDYCRTCVDARMAEIAENLKSKPPKRSSFDPYRNPSAE